MWFFWKNNYSQPEQSTDNQSDIKDLSPQCFCFSYLYCFRGGKQMFTRQGKVQSGEKYFHYIIYKEKVPTLAGNKHFSLQFLCHRTPHLHLLKIINGLDPSELQIKAFITAPTINNN